MRASGKSNPPTVPAIELPDKEGAAVEVVEGAAPVDPGPLGVGVAGEVTVMTEVDDFRKIPSFDVDVIS